MCIRDRMLKAFWASPIRNTLLWLAGVIFLVIVSTAYGQIRLNRWNEPFYDALARRDFQEFLVQLGVFGIIAGALLVLNVFQRWLTETFKLKLRAGLTLDLIELWMLPRRAFRLVNAGPVGVNPDQRMHDDARRLTELSADLGIGLLQATILLVTFVSVLWALSADFAFPVAGRMVPIPGYMVWAGILYAGFASVLSYWVGRNLIGRNAERYAREADLRFSLVRVNEHIDAISLAGGEADEARRIKLNLAAVIPAMRGLVTGYTKLTWITAGYGWLTVVAPILVAAPLYFSGTLTFGGLMMAAGAFTQVQSSLRWFVDNFGAIADWRATASSWWEGPEPAGPCCVGRARVCGRGARAASAGREARPSSSCHASHTCRPALCARSWPIRRASKGSSRMRSPRRSIGWACDVWLRCSIAPRDGTPN